MILYLKEIRPKQDKLFHDKLAYRAVIKRHIVGYMYV